MNKSTNWEKPKVNFKNVFRLQSEWAKLLKQLCPDINDRSGIYFWMREIDGEKLMYIGKATHLIQRSIAHCMGYEQRLDISIRKYGFYDEIDNPIGWQLKVMNVPQAQLDEKERFYIEHYKQRADIELYNIESGGTDGKEIIGERKEGKGYHDGLQQGYKNAVRELKHIADLHLEIKTKGDKPNKVHEKALQKFFDILNGGNGNGMQET